MATWTLIERSLSDGLPMRLFVAEDEGAIVHSCLHDDVHARTSAEWMWTLGRDRRWEQNASTPVLEHAAQQVGDYFLGRRTEFDLPVRFQGTPFQVLVWKQLMQIPAGQTASYGDVAERIGKPAASRAVGGANGRNKLPVFVPCHRVIAAGGKLGGFTGGLGLKQRLLLHEQMMLSSSDKKPD